MTQLVWNRVGDRRYEAGIDRGVLYLLDGRVATWNGLLGIEESFSSEFQPLYLDGVKYMERFTSGDYASTLRAFTYPDEFAEVIGEEEVFSGFTYHGSNPKHFNLCYRTRVGDDVYGSNAGYIIHILYNVIARVPSRRFAAIGDAVSLSEFSWELRSVPPQVDGYPPTTHISIDSTKTDPGRIAAMENILYGSDTSDPYLPSIDVITNLFINYDSLVITDNGDGTWTAVDLSESFITINNTETFTIDNADAEFLAADTYNISTTPPI